MHNPCQYAVLKLTVSGRWVLDNRAGRGKLPTVHEKTVRSLDRRRRGMLEGRRLTFPQVVILETYGCDVNMHVNINEKTSFARYSGSRQEWRLVDGQRLDDGRLDGGSVAEGEQRSAQYHGGSPFFQEVESHT